MPKGRTTNHMSRPILKYLWSCLIEGYFSHMLEWSDRKKLQFSVLFMNKRNKSFEEKYLALFKAMDNIFPQKAEKYKKRPDHDKECKKRCHSNLQKLCSDGVLKYLRKTKIKENESPSKFYYQFIKVPDDFTKEKYIKDSEFGNKVDEKDIRSDTFHYSCLSNTDPPILLSPHQSDADVSFYETTTDEILLESKIPHMSTSQNIDLEHAINNGAPFLVNTEHLPQSEISVDLNALLDTTKSKSVEYVTPLQDNVDIISTYTPAKKRMGTYDALTSLPSKRKRVEAPHPSSRSGVPGPEPSPPSSPDNRRTPILLDSIISHMSISQNIDLEHAINNGAPFLVNTDNEHLPHSEISVDLKALLDTTKSKSLEYVTPLQDNVDIISTYEQTFIGKTNDTSLYEIGTHDSPMRYNSILLDSIISHTSQNIDLEHAINNDAPFLISTDNDQLPQAENSFGFNALLGPTKSNDLENFTQFQDNVDIISTYEKSKEVFTSDINSENEGCSKKENESSQQEVSLLEGNSQPVSKKEESGNVMQMDEDMPLPTEHYDTVESDELLRSFLPAIY